MRASLLLPLWRRVTAVVSCLRPALHGRHAMWRSDDAKRAAPTTRNGSLSSIHATGLGAHQRLLLLRRDGVAGKIVEEPQIIAQVRRGEELVANLLASTRAHRVRDARVLHKIERALGTLLDAVHQIAGLAVLYLQLDA